MYRATSLLVRSRERSSDRLTFTTRPLIAYSATVAGFSLILPMADRFSVVGAIPVLYLVLFLPVIGAGTFRFIQRSRIMAPISFLLGLILLGTTWSALADIPRGLLLFLTVFATAAFGALLDSHDKWLLAARFFVVFASLSSVVVLADFLMTGTARLGTVVNKFNVRIIEPNQVGTFVAFTIIIALISIEFSRDRLCPSGWNVLIAILIPFLITVLLLSQSRGAIITLIGSLLVLFALGRAKRYWAFWFLVATGAVGIASILYYWRDLLLQRFDSGSVSTYGGRTEIWSTATDLIFRHSPLGRLWFGYGSGSPGTALGRFRPELASLLGMERFGANNDVAPNINTHSSYFEFFLSFGLTGLVAGAAVLFFLFRRAFSVDRGRNLAGGLALLTFFLLTSFSLVAYRLLGISIACGALTIGYLYGTMRPPEPSLKRSNAGSITRTSTLNLSSSRRRSAE